MSRLVARSAFAALCLATVAAELRAIPQPALEPVTRFTLSRDSVVDGVHCGPTRRASVELHANGRLSECPLWRDTVIAGHALPRETWPRFTETGVLTGAWLPHDLTLQGLPCKGDGYKKWAVRFHASGHLALCYLSTPTVIDGVPCHSAWFWRELRGTTQVQLHDDGRLKSCRLSRDVTLDGVAYRKGQRIERS